MFYNSVTEWDLTTVAIECVLTGDIMMARLALRALRRIHAQKTAGKLVLS